MSQAETNWRELQTEAIELIDIGCNLTHDAFDDDREEVLERAREAGVVQLVVTGASAEGSTKALELARSLPGEVFATAGVHPHRARDFDDDTEALIRELIGHDEVVAVGEAGLDYFRDFSPRPAQREVFERQLGIGRESGLPLFLHMRDAHDDFVAMLRETRDALCEVVVHCFTGNRDQLYDYLDLDCHIGLTGWICDERRGTHIQDFLGDIPAGRLMVETDSPYLKPRDLRPLVKTHRNEPQWLPWIVKTVAQAVGKPVQQVARETTATARKFFGLPVPD